MSQWTAENPGAGSPPDIRAASSRRTTEASTIRSAGGTLAAATNTAREGWQGLGANALVTSVDPLRTELDVLAAQSDTDAATLLRYANEVDAIQQAQNSLSNRMNQIKTQISRKRLAQGAPAVTDENEQWYARTQIDDLTRQIDSLTRQLTGLSAQLHALAQQRNAADSAAIMALTTLESRGVFSPTGGILGGGASTITLQNLVGLSELDLATIATVHPDLVDELFRTSAPTEVNAWWTSLTADQQTALTIGASNLVGALNGLPPAVRVAANRVNAAKQLPDLEQREFTGDVSNPTAVNANFVSPRYVDYLRRVVNGDVQLYLWRPEKGAVIEMSGDPHTAKSALFVVPGTNASISEFISDSPTTEFANWQVEYSRTHTVLAFTVLTGPMPHLTPDPVDFWSNGPQNNAFVTARAPELAAFEQGVFTALPDLPTVAYEHSYTTAIGSAAEALGGTPTVRVLAGGVGATHGYEPSQNVAPYAIQAPNDINRYYAGVQLWEVGFGVAPERIPGIRVLDSEMGGIPVNPLVASLEGPASLALQAPWSVENHINLMSDDESVNGAALHHVQSLLETGGGR